MDGGGKRWSHWAVGVCSAVSEVQDEHKWNDRDDRKWDDERDELELQGMIEG